MISPDERYSKQRAQVNGRSMAYVETGSGDPIVFQHGNPTSSYLWRNVIPHLEGLGRCIAPDLIGMGDSEKLPDSGPDRYTFAEHREYFDGLLEQLGVTENVTFVIHDWGSALGFDWANRHRDRVKGIAYMEAIVRPLSWAQWPDAATKLFVNADPGAILIGEQREFCRSWPNQTELTVPGNHFLQEDSPDEIGRAIADWLKGL